MYKKILGIFCFLLSSASWAGDYYFYLENPDPSKYTIVWENSPEPNCHEIGPNGYETYGWIIHDNALNNPAPVYAYIALKDNPQFVSLKYSYDNGAAGNTAWATLPGYVSYRTWACG